MIPSEFIEDYLIDRNEGTKKIFTRFLNQVMQQEALNQIKAQPYERTGRRKARRNGTRKRPLKTIHGDIVLDKPQFREFPFKTQVFERFSRVEKSLTSSTFLITNNFGTVTVMTVIITLFTSFTVFVVLQYRMELSRVVLENARQGMITAFRAIKSRGGS
jgi:hypothetical protein